MIYKLNVEDAAYILFMKGSMSATDLANEHGVKKTIIYDIWKGKLWAKKIAKWEANDE